jgi:F-type H+-transporting ATPase subunit alpha
VRTSHPGILDAIRDEKAVSNDTEAKLKAAVEAFAKAFA